MKILMNIRMLLALLAYAAVIPFFVSAQDEAAQTVQIISFEAPGVATGQGQGTVPTDINDEREVVGYYLDANNEWHGFLRAPDGVITSFDPPGSLQTEPGSINSKGEIAGYYFDASNRGWRGFLRTRDGNFDTFGLPGGVSGVSTSILPAINRRGEITGNYTNKNSVPVNFLRAPDGTITTFVVPNSTGSFANSINPEGTVAGYDYVVITQPSFELLFHGFVREPDGTITTFDVPGALDTFATSNSINPAGVIAGNYYDKSKASHGYVRAPDGTFETFDVPGAGTGPFQGTGLSEVVINSTGSIAGTYVDAKNVAHGFMRSCSGEITTFDPPGSANTYPDSINLHGTIAGSYLDANNASHGFLRLSKCDHHREDNQ